MTWILSCGKCGWRGRVRSGGDDWRWHTKALCFEPLKIYN